MPPAKSLRRAPLCRGIDSHLFARSKQSVHRFIGLRRIGLRSRQHRVERPGEGQGLVEFGRTNRARTSVGLRPPRHRYFLRVEEPIASPSQLK